MIAEIEFYRNGRKVVGTGYGTAGSWGNEAAHTYTAALDGDTDSFFNGPVGKECLCRRRFAGSQFKRSYPHGHGGINSGATMRG